MQRIVIRSLLDKSLSCIYDALCVYTFDDLNRLSDDEVERRHKMLKDLLRPYNSVSPMQFWNYMTRTFVTPDKGYQQKQLSPEAQPSDPFSDYEIDERVLACQRFFRALNERGSKWGSALQEKRMALQHLQSQLNRAPESISRSISRSKSRRASLDVGHLFSSTLNAD